MHTQIYKHTVFNIYTYEEREHHTKEKSGSTLVPLVQLIDITYPKVALSGRVSSASTGNHSKL